MNTWIKRGLAGLLGAAVVVGSLSACGHRMQGERWNASAEQVAERQAKMVARVADRLDLDAAQRSKLQVLAAKLAEQRAALMAGAHPREQAQALVAGEKFDRAGAQALVDQKTAAVRAKAPEVVTALGDFYDSLTPAQQDKVRAFMQRRGGWRG